MKYLLGVIFGFILLWTFIFIILIQIDFAKDIGTFIGKIQKYADEAKESK